MANLRANKITSTEVFETTGSVQFDGSGDYLSLASSADFSFGTGDFTVEFWLYRTDTGNNVGLLDTRSSNVDTNGWFIRFNSSTTIQLVDSAIQYITATHNSGWNHITFVRKSGIITGYINGIFGGSTNTTKDFTSSNFLMGGFVDTQSSPNAFGGHISNLRVLKGTALYTKNFTPPSRELTVIPNTVLLACTSTTNTAQEATGKTITVNGNAVANELTPGLLTDRVKSGGTSAITGSVEFDGTGDYLSIPSSSDFAFGTGDFTVECWIYEQNRSPSNYTILFHTDGSNLGGFVLSISPGSGGILGIYVGGFIVTSTSSVPTNGWVHIAATRNSGTTRLFINGVLGGSTATSYTPTFNDIRIGLNSSSYAEKYNGFISNLRVLKGTALYTGSFIPPTRELKKIPNTVLLCCKNSSDPTAEETGKTITANGDPAASNFTPQIGSDGSVTFDGVTKINTQNYFYIPTGNTENRGRGRGVIGAGYVAPARNNTIDYMQIQSTGNAIDFGDLTVSRSDCANISSSTRGIFAGGIIGYSNVIDFFTIATTSNAVDFGDLIVANQVPEGVSNSTRGLIGGGKTPASNPAGVNTIEYITIASLGNAQDFGDLLASQEALFGTGSTTRGIFAGGYGPANNNVIQYVTIASTGNAADFGDLTVARGGGAGGGNSTRGLFYAGYSAPSLVNTIDFITIATLGDAQDFGDAISIRSEISGCCSIPTRGVFSGGNPNTNAIEFVTISSTGNAQDFGDLTVARRGTSSLSDSHGGIEG